MSRRLLEIAANSLASALAAQEGGADRVELCENLGDGGCTPSYGTIALARERLHIPLYVLIRPRAGDFLYDALEREVMLRDIESCVRLGCDGVVIGALADDGSVDEVLCRELIAAAGTLGITFHRAFDVARDQAQALETLISLACERVLTSGAQSTAPEGADTIAALARQADRRIRVMAGAGISEDNLAGLVTRSGANEFHASAKALRSSPMQHVSQGIAGLDAHWLQSDVDRVRALRAALDAA